MSMDEAVAMITRMDDALDKEVDRVQEAMRSKRMDTQKLDDLSLHAATLMKIKGSLVIALSMLSSRDIANARWHKARRGHGGR